MRTSHAHPLPLSKGEVERMDHTMRTFITILFVVLAVSVSAGTIENQNAVFEGEIAPSVNGYFANGKGASAFFLVGEQYAEGYVSFGRSETIGSVFVAAEAGLGVEQTPSGFGRMLAASVFAKFGNVSFLGVAERGSGMWYKFHIKWNVVPQVSLGILAKRHSGIGPRLDIRIPHTPLTVWGALQNRSGIIAVNSTF